MTLYGINPSFQTYWARQILFADPIRRAKRFEVYDDAGNSTGVMSPLGADGWPVEDGRWHGAQLFSDMLGTSPLLEDTAGVARFRQNSNAASMWWRTGRPLLRPLAPTTAAGFYRPGVAAMVQFKPKAIRTLDWQRTNDRPNWSLPRVPSDWPTQGGPRGIAIEHQVAAANACGASAWWCAPPRFELSVSDWQARIEEMLTVIRDAAQHPPVLEWGNEAWNEGFALNRWLQTEVTASLPRWPDVAAREIEAFWVSCERVFAGRQFYRFVGGDRENPATLERILDGLSRPPDIAGPAAYVGAKKADMRQWEAGGIVPSQETLRASTFARATEVEARLREHKTVLVRKGVRLFGLYEAGQAFIAKGAPWKRAAVEAQRAPWMGDLYRELRAAFERQRVDVACWYSLATSQNPADSRVDVFGLLETNGGPLLPKALAARVG